MNRLHPIMRVILPTAIAGGTFYTSTIRTNPGVKNRKGNESHASLTSPIYWQAKLDRMVTNYKKPHKILDSEFRHHMEDARFLKTFKLLHYPVGNFLNLIY